MNRTGNSNFAIRSLQLAALRALREATDALMSILDDLTLSDIAANPEQLLNRIAPLQNGIVATARTVQ